MNELPVLLIDNRSPFCSETMRMIFKNGGHDKFNFISIYSEESKNLLMKYGIVTSGERLMVLCEQGKVFTNSEALLQAVRKLKGLKRLLYWFIIVPHKIRDTVYDRLTDRSKEDY